MDDVRFILLTFHVLMANWQIERHIHSQRQTNSHTNSHTSDIHAHTDQQTKDTCTASPDPISQTCSTLFGASSLDIQISCAAASRWKAECRRKTKCCDNHDHYTLKHLMRQLTPREVSHSSLSLLVLLLSSLPPDLPSPFGLFIMTVFMGTYIAALYNLPRSA